MQKFVKSSARSENCTAIRGDTMSRGETNCCARTCPERHILRRNCIAAPTREIEQTPCVENFGPDRARVDRRRDRDRMMVAFAGRCCYMHCTMIKARHELRLTASAS